MLRPLREVMIPAGEIDVCSKHGEIGEEEGEEDEGGRREYMTARFLAGTPEV